MNGNSIFLGTNIVLYLISGDRTLANLLDNKTIYISFISELELLGYKEISPEELKVIEDFLTTVSIIDINSEIKRITTGLKRNYKIKLPDAIIAATSHYMNLPLMTSDKAMTKLLELNILQYEK
ncbi:type II toxin-antitoxin system VapC family toxin [Lunatibacter salilacus]|uniref:type II toxin-antitoxin system VapC family toxin n=1 Tax=Lunatibacter salilacus TaxID=2483804 RepID=UPI00131E32F5|nr:type II toxin-antitoxin system VapC family toxin [Lunatibacter salilacus]